MLYPFVPKIKDYNMKKVRGWKKKKTRIRSGEKSIEGEKEGSKREKIIEKR